MLTTVVLGGPLGARFGREWKLELGVPSPAEAVRALSAVCEGFGRYLVENSAPGFHVLVGERDVGAQELGVAKGERITILPALAGSKQAGVLQVVLGAVLIAGGAVLSVYDYGTAGGQLIALGSSLMVGGAAQLLFGPPRATGPLEKPEHQPSYVFNGPVNTLAQGHPVALCYGEMVVGSCVVSAGIITDWSVGGGFGGPAGGQTGPGGQGAVGGGCPAPWVPILLSDGREVPAGELRVGAWVRTQDEVTLAWGDYPVTQAATLDADCRRLVLEDGRELVATYNHRVRTEADWVELRHLERGARLVGEKPGVVARVEEAGRGPVVLLTVAGAHTYQTLGVLSHNVKRADPEEPHEVPNVP
ncbi:hypothetical protein LXT21_44170 [Myxococcus sp. K38C18041901]|uniref:hypothetical protein n=1 Tax=Myxococcus guangdongensis TaxID=2906760 RepID=UPI0020A80075|nr:hypothetical protein [Myxococcus guangdongensis]MCP3065786.1 hypothetical protein [Myxococcus guangdongensis]